MSKSPTQVGQSTTTTNTTVPPYIAAAQQALMEAALGMTSPFLTSPAFTVAGFTPPQELAFDLTNYQAQQAFTNPGLNVTDFGSYLTNPANAGQAALATPASAVTPAAASAAMAKAASIDPAAVSLMKAAQMGPAALAEAIKADPAVLSVAEQLGYKDISKFFNPYQKDVVDTTVSQLEDANSRSLNAIRARQAAESSYGGNRGALEESEQYRNYGNTLAQTIAALNQSGWNNAAQLGMGNTQLRQQTGLANQSAQNQVGALNAQLAQQTGLANQSAQNQAAALNAQMQQQAGLSNQAAKNLAQTLNAQFQQQTSLANAAGANQVGMANAAGANQVGLANMGAQNQIGLANAAAQNQFGMQNAAWQQQSNLFNAQQPLQVAQLQNQLNQTPWAQQLQALQLLLSTGGQQQQLAQQALNTPFNMLNILQGTVPSTTGTNSSTTQPINGPSQFQSILPLLALGGSLLSGASDETLKTDKQKLGKDPRTGLDMYAYRYKGDPKNTMKVVGPMAQDVEKKYPGSTTRVGGKMAIKPNARALLGV